MTILSPQTLLNVLDLVAEGATLVETTTAIGGAPKSKIIFSWLNDSADAGEFDATPSPESPWCVMWRDRLEWFHIAYQQAALSGKEARAARKSPMRAELEQLLEAKRRATPPKSQNTPPVFNQAGIVLDPPPLVSREPAQSSAPAPCTRPAYAYRKPLDTVNGQGPPMEGRFTVSTHSYSLAERRGGTVSVTDDGIKRW